MTKVNSFDKNNLKALRVDMDAALKEVADKYGITIKAGNARFSPNTVTFKVEANTIGDAGEVYNKEREALKTMYPEYLDKVIRLSNGQEGKVVEYHFRKKKYPFIVETLVGKKRYKVSEFNVHRGA